MVRGGPVLSVGSGNICSLCVEKGPLRHIACGTSIGPEGQLTRFCSCQQYLDQRRLFFNMRALSSVHFSPRHRLYKLAWTRFELIAGALSHDSDPDLHLQRNSHLISLCPYGQTRGSNRHFKRCVCPKLTLFDCGFLLDGPKSGRGSI